MTRQLDDELMIAALLFALLLASIPTSSRAATPVDDLQFGLYTCREGTSIDCSAVALDSGQEDAGEMPSEAIPDSLSGSAQHRATSLARQPDEKRPADQFQTILFGRPLTIGGELGTNSRYQQNFRLEDGDSDDRNRLRQGVQLEFFYAATRDLFAFAEARLAARLDLDPRAGSERFDSALRRGESWLYIANVFDSAFSLQVGRQHFRDKREWWFDEDLDSVRLHYDRPKLHLEVGVAQELGATTFGEEIDPEDEDIARLLGLVTWEWTRKHRLELFILRHNDLSSRAVAGTVVPDVSEDDSDADLTWLGFRARGRWKSKALKRIDYWFDYGLVRGDESLADYDNAGDALSVVDEVAQRTVRGWGVDFGVTWQSRLPGKLRLSAGYAYGSGDEEVDDGVDRTFRQTGLQDNNHKFRGVSRFRYYGELLQPELSNLRITTASVGTSLTKQSSVELIYHAYDQVDAASSLRDSNIGARTLGASRDVGREIDLVIGIEEWPHVELEFVAAAFEAGDAFAEKAGKRAYSVTMQVDYNF